MSDSAAVITTAASAVCGRSASSELRNSSSTTTRPAPTTPVSWLFAPDCSATAVREPLVETANPWNSPAARLAAPSPIISWFGSTSSPRRAAKLVAVAIVSVSETSVMPTAAMTGAADVARCSSTGTLGVGTPWGSEPDGRDPVGRRSSTAETIVTPTTATRIAGTRGSEPRQHEQDDEHAQPDDQRRRVGLVDVAEELLDLVDEPVRVGREAEELRQLAHDDRDAEPVHVADLHLAREQVGDEAELPEAERHLDEPDEEGEHAGERDRGRRVADGEQRDDRGEDQRRDRRVGSEHQHPRRAEHGVADQARDRRVQPGDGRQPGQLRVRHALGHQDRGEHEPGDGVEPEPLLLVAAHEPDAGHPASDRVDGLRHGQ